MSQEKSGTFLELCTKSKEFRIENRALHRVVRFTITRKQDRETDKAGQRGRKSGTVTQKKRNKETEKVGQGDRETEDAGQ